MTDPVQSQLTAYNNRDINAFAPCFTADVEAYELQTSTLIFKGRDALITRYGAMFNRSPNLHCKLLSRTIEGNITIDHESVTGMRDNDEIRAIAIYHVTPDGIDKVWFA